MGRISRKEINQDFRSELDTIQLKVTPIVSNLEPIENLEEGLIWYNPVTSKTKMYLDGAFRDVSSSGTTVDGNFTFVSYTNTTVLETNSNTATIGIYDYDKTKDTLMVFQNSTFKTEGVDYTISEDSKTITKVSGEWTSGTSLTFVMLGTVQGNADVISVIRLASNYTASGGETVIPINNTSFNKDVDILEVFKGREVLFEDTDYTISIDNTQITLTGTTVNASDKFTFYTWKKVRTNGDNLDGTWLTDGTVSKAKLTTELQTKMDMVSDHEDRLGDIELVQEVNVTDYASVISVPSTVEHPSQVKVGFGGLSAVNLVKNGNYANGTTNWVLHFSTLSANNGTLTITSDGTQSTVRAYQNLGNKFENKKLFVKARMRATNNSCSTLHLWFRDGNSGTTFGYSGTERALVNNPVKDQWYSVSGVIDIATISLTNNLVLYIEHGYSDVATANSKAVEVQEVMVYDLTSTFGVGNEPDKATCDKIFANWFDGIGSVEGFKVKSIGKNLINEANIEPLGGSYIVPVWSSSNKIRFDNSSNINTRSLGLFPIYLIKDKIYCVSQINKTIISGSNVAISVLDYTKTQSFGAISTTYTATYTGLHYIQVNTAYGSLQQIELNIQLEEDTIATAYEPYHESITYVGERLKSLPNGVKDEITKDGKFIKRVGEYTLKDSDILTLATTLTNIDYININKPSDMIITGDSTGNSMLTTISTPSLGQGLTNSVSNVWKHYVKSTANFVLTIPKSTYVSLATAQSALAGTKIIYELAVPITIDLNLSPIVAHPKGTLIFNPITSLSTNGLKSMTFKGNRAGQIDGNTEMIKQLGNITIKGNGERVEIGEATVSANTTSTYVTVTFNKSFTELPKIVASISALSLSSNANVLLYIPIHLVSTTSFQVAISSSVAQTVSIGWVAVGK